jgi:integrase
MSLEKTKDREIKRDPRTGIFYYRGTPIRGGSEITRSLGVRTFGSAVLKKKDLLLELRGIDPSAKDILFRDYVKVFLQERERKAPATYEQAFYSCDNLLPFFEHYTMKEVSSRAWDEYVDYQAKVKPGRNLRYDKRHLLMMLLRLKKKGIIKEVPELEYKDSGHKRRRSLTQAEVELLLSKASNTLYGLILIMWKMGLRPGEILGAPWAEINLVTGVWTIAAERTKTRKSRSIKINPTVLAWLYSRRASLDLYAAKKGYDKPLHVFPSKGSAFKKPIDRYNKQWVRLLEDCGMDKTISPYFLRHTFLTECAKKIRQGQLNLAMVATYAGTSIKMIEDTYLHIEGEDTKLVADLMESPE